MAEINHRDRSIRVKIVYYGPAVGGKTTNLKVLFDRALGGRRGQFLSVNSAQDRTILCDLLPLRSGGFRGHELKLQLAAVPGQAMYAASRRIILRGVDGIVFVANSATDRWHETQQSFQEMTANLLAQRLDPRRIPLVLQYNKRDLPQVMPIADLSRALNDRRALEFAAVASKGQEFSDLLRDPRWWSTTCGARTPVQAARGQTIGLDETGRAGHVGALQLEPRPASPRGPRRSIHEGHIHAAGRPVAAPVGADSKASDVLAGVLTPRRQRSSASPSTSCAGATCCASASTRCSAHSARDRAPARPTRPRRACAILQVLRPGLRLPGATPLLTQQGTAQVLRCRHRGPTPSRRSGALARGGAAHARRARHCGGRASSAESA
jgi:signal recognition particle receptor subunit beta